MIPTRDSFLNYPNTAPLVTREVAPFGLCSFRPMSCKDRDALRREMRGSDGTYDARNVKGYEARIVMATLCDPQGRLLFGPGDLDKVCEIPSDVIDRLAEIGTEASQLGTDAVEDAEKN